MMAFLLQDMADVYIGAQTALGFPTITKWMHSRQTEAATKPQARSPRFRRREGRLLRLFGPS